MQEEDTGIATRDYEDQAQLECKARVEYDREE
jgi:hypothetical protein